jgi:Putative transposase/Transposase zinc-binding domain
VSRPALEVADIFRAHGPAYLEAFGETISSEQRRVLKDLTLCRTAALGGHVEACTACGHRQIAYNSCRNRHCPKCQAATRAAWLEARAADLLPTDYYHAVFTLPHQLGPLALQNQRVVYGLLFRATAETLLQIAADERHLGATIGFHAVLHTWGQNLLHHPHVHCVVPGGGLSLDKSRWVSSPQGFFLPVHVLGEVFRGKFLQMLAAAFAAGELAFHGKLVELHEARSFQALLEATTRTPWVVYVKPPFGGPERVLQYLARYTHRVAISNHRLLALEDGQVTFLWKDYAQGQVEKPMTVSALEFIRRFLLHVVPSGFMRIRHYGLLANRQRQDNVRCCRKLLETVVEEPVQPEARTGSGDDDTESQKEWGCCPACHQGVMVIVEKLPADPHAGDRFRRIPIHDTS